MAKMAEGQRKVAIAVDNSENAASAFEWYLKHVRRENDSLCVIHVPEYYDLSLTSPAVASEVLRQLSQEVAALEKKYEEKMKAAKIGGKFRTGAGKPGEVICKIAEEEKATMILVGTRGMGKIRRTIMGSTSDYLVHHAKMPVIVCRH